MQNEFIEQVLDEDAEMDAHFAEIMNAEYEQIEKEEQEKNRKNNRLFGAIERQIGKGFLENLKKVIVECECNGFFQLVRKPTGKFQDEHDFGCIVGYWVEQYSGHLEDDFYGNIYVKLKNGLFIKMHFAD